jgi:hypothetical protein
MWLRGDGLRRGWGQEFAAVLDQLLSIAVGQKSEMSDLNESAGEHMQEKPPDELDRLQGRFFNLIVVLRVSPAEVDLAVFEL